MASKLTLVESGWYFANQILGEMKLSISPNLLPYTLIYNNSMDQYQPAATLAFLLESEVSLITK